MADAVVNWYGDDVKVRVAQSSDTILRKAAFDIQAGAQDAAPVDTGFLKNSIYTVTETSSGYGGAGRSGVYRNSAGESVLRELAPEAQLPNDAEALVCAGAEYAVFVELRRSFLYPAAERVARAIGATIQQVGRQVFG